jgi:L-glyceraldehyde 3-phosphate reductase
MNFKPSCWKKGLGISLIVLWMEVTSALIGASKLRQLEDNIAALNNSDFSKEELDEIEEILK